MEIKINKEEIIVLSLLASKQASNTKNTNPKSSPLKWKTLTNADPVKDLIKFKEIYQPAQTSHILVVPKWWHKYFNLEYNKDAIVETYDNYDVINT